MHTNEGAFKFNVNVINKKDLSISMYLYTRLYGSSAFTYYLFFIKCALHYITLHYITYVHTYLHIYVLTKYALSHLDMYVL